MLPAALVAACVATFCGIWLVVLYCGARDERRVLDAMFFRPCNIAQLFGAVGPGVLPVLRRLMADRLVVRRGDLYQLTGAGYEMALRYREKDDDARC